tara:strand:+ start:293 stop:508 length:216 start_codon:yes stop_codon:yes gene_type:complete
MEQLVLMLVRDTLLVVDKVEKILLVLVDMVVVEIFQVVMEHQILEAEELVEMIHQKAQAAKADLVSLLFVT